MVEKLCQIGCQVSFCHTSQNMLRHVNLGTFKADEFVIAVFKFVNIITGIHIY